ncbi:receptor-type tyrosine-protein phosphatase eta isoform X2 [Ahaetulla prasina]|uniref:receptor-type tyrosine-protein phosphatase eta isoform X2 n=1 Tax=Ahaetulla prasina TaxID=499056 RepID=UPI0026474258|nr:receptor-type tyrosine-protein phosphatase eta isoform X2 [Ahaetulla prasina]
MRGLAQVFFLVLLYLGKVKVTAACIECGSLNNITVTETTISVQLNNNFTITSVTFQNKSVVGLSKNDSISELYPGFQYIVHFNNTEESKSCCKYIFTKPSPVSNIQANHLNSTSIILTWTNEDVNAFTYIYKILKKGPGFHNDTFSNIGNTTVSNLQPGTLYSFEIATQINGTNITGDTQEISLHTKPSPVYDIKAENITTTSVDLKWKNNDTNSSNYTYRILIDGLGHSDNKTSDTTSVSIPYLKPGTLYRFEIYAQLDDNKTEGEPNGINVYTKPNPVYDIKAENITTTSLDLTWKNNDTNSSNYTYRTHIDGPDHSDNKTSDTTSVSIPNLKPGTLYRFEIYAQLDDNKTEGEPNGINVYTRPSPVYDIEFENVTTTTLDIKWKNNDTNASNYTYQIYINGPSYFDNKTSNSPYVKVDSLEPGTLYRFEIYAEIDGSKGDPKDTSVYTKPTPVYDIKAENINTTSLDLSWKNNDANASNYTYRIHIDRPPFSCFSNITHVSISHLEPGRFYKFEIFAQVNGNKTEGDPNGTTVYTKPSSVVNITVKDVSTTVVNVSWESPDAAASSYSYKILINGIPNKISPTTNTEISELNPGTNYQFSIYSIAADNKTEGTPKNIIHCTNPASVDRFDCNLVEKEPKLSLNWSPPNGSYEGFRIEVLNNNWNKTLEKKYQTIVTGLDYFTTYTIRIVTLSCTKMSVPQEKKCRTSITDPPPLLMSPTVKAISHNSFSVQFNSFSSNHGPITAYAVIIATSEGSVSNETLKYTYNDFRSKETNAYVAYITTEEKRSSPSTQNQDYVVEIGNESKTYGYFNGKLNPLGSYRACIAAFTRIAFLNETIVNAEKSYVSFSHLSPFVALPENPAVITGGVVGSILVLLVIVIIVGVIFWKKKRKGRNNEVPFTQIESKLLKVENYESYFKKQKADSNCGFAEEYEDLRPVGANQPKFAAELSENKGKNRYNNVLPYDISRVKLSVLNHSTDDYINANYMPGYNSKKEFIAAQGPLPNTVQDFWRMIWEKKIYTVVMLTKCVEQGRTKCEEYWPNKQSKNYGDIMVAMTSEIFLPEWTIRDFSIQQSDSPESHPVRQFHFTAWPDHGVPETTDLLISFRHLVHEFMKQKPPSSPTLVHCSAGVGRTGTFISIDRLIQQMEIENTVDVYGTVYDLRMHRSLMVQTEDQYVFLNHCVMDIIKSNKEKKMDLIYQNTDAMAIYENFTPSSPYIGRANGYHV